MLRIETNDVLLHFVYSAEEKKGKIFEEKIHFSDDVFQRRFKADIVTA